MQRGPVSRKYKSDPGSGKANSSINTISDEINIMANVCEYLSQVLQSDGSLSLYTAPNSTSCTIAEIKTEKKIVV